MLLIGVVGAIGSWSPKRQPTAPSAAIKSFAVLPFKPIVANERDEAMEIGMADTLIAKLSNLRQLIVRPTSAVRRYAALDQDPLAAGREQRVDAVLESSFQRSGRKLRVTVRLLDVRDGSAIWAYQCEELCNDVFTAQDRISERVARALAPELSGEEQKLLAKRYTDNFEAYQLYVKGRFFWDKGTEKGMKKSVEYYEQAIRLDPNYALAYSGLATTCAATAAREFITRVEAEAKAEAAARKALEIDEQLSEAHFVLALLHYFHWRWAEGEREFQRAIELSPNDSTIRLSHSHWLLAHRRFDEALAEVERAQELDPLSPIGVARVGWVLFHVRRYDLAIAQFRKALEMNPYSSVNRAALCRAYTQTGNYSEAIAELRQVVAANPRRGFERASLGYAYAMSGQRSEAIKVLGELIEESKHRTELADNIVEIYAGLGEKDQAFAWLEKAYQLRMHALIFLNANPHFDSLRSDPRFQDKACCGACASSRM